MANNETFEDFLKRNGYKNPKYPTFEQWCDTYFDANNDGTIDKKEARKRSNALKKPETAAQLMALHQSELDAITAKDLQTRANLEQLWNTSVAGTASQSEIDAQAKATAEAGNAAAVAAGALPQEKNGLNTTTILIIAAAAVALLLFMKK